MTRLCLNFKGLQQNEFGSDISLNERANHFSTDCTSLKVAGGSMLNLERQQGKEPLNDNQARLAGIINFAMDTITCIE